MRSQLLANGSMNQPWLVKCNWLIKIKLFSSRTSVIMKVIQVTWAHRKWWVKSESLQEWSSRVQTLFSSKRPASADPKAVWLDSLPYKYAVFTNLALFDETWWIQRWNEWVKWQFLRLQPSLAVVLRIHFIHRDSPLQWNPVLSSVMLGWVGYS